MKFQTAFFALALSVVTNKATFVFAGTVSW